MSALGEGIHNNKTYMKKFVAIKEGNCIKEVATIDNPYVTKQLWKKVVKSLFTSINGKLPSLIVSRWTHI